MTIEKETLPPDDLTQIYGIGPVFAQGLNKIGVYRYVELARYTPERLSVALLEQAGLSMPPERIEAKNWIGQALEMAQEQDETVLDDLPLPATKPSTDWHTHAAFSLFFEFREDGPERQWQTRIYHDKESGEEVPVAGTAVADWLPEILTRADLPLLAVAEPVPAEEAVAVEIVDIATQELDVSDDSPEPALLVDITFKLSGDDAPVAAANGRLFHTEAHLFNELDESIADIISSAEPLQPDTFTYRSRQKLLVPPPGQYKLQCAVTVG